MSDTATVSLERERLPGIPKTPEGLDAEWLAAALAAAGYPGCRIQSVARQRIGEGVGILAELYRLTPDYAPGSAPGPASVVAKMHASHPEARGICAAYRFYERETHFYQDVAATIDLQSPRHYASSFDPASGDCVILLEDMAGAECPDQIVGIPLDMLTEAIDSVAALHARWWEDPHLADLAAIMPAIDEPPYSSVPDIYRASLPLALERLEALGQHDLARVAVKFGVAIDRLMTELATGPRTLCHGDFRTDNLMFRLTPEGPKLTAIDWQIVMQARGPYDVGYLMSGAVDTEMRRANEDRLLRRYHAALVSRGVTGYDFATCLQDYRRALLVGLNYWVQGFAVSDQSIPRAVALFDSWAGRLDAAVKDLGLEALVE
jgi:hypothetical protein